MLDIRAVIERVGPTLLRTVILPGSTDCVGDVVIAEPDQSPTVAEGDLVLGVAVGDRDAAVRLSRECGAQGAAAVLLKPPLCADPAVIAAAEETGLALVEVRPGTAWAQLVWLIRAALAGTAVEDTDTRSPGLGDLFKLADAVADVVDAPVTIEDAHSQVLAYSARQDLTDPARVSTIMGRKQPDDVLAKFRARGTFRQLSKGSSAIFVPGQQDGTLPRLVVPIRMGGELLGSMWAVVPGEVSVERSTAFADTAPLVALQLLRWRAVADAERQRSADQVRQLLEGGDRWRVAASELGVSHDPHRVAAIEVSTSAEEAEGHRLAMWEWITRGVGRRPLVTEVGNVLYALVPDRPGPGGWPVLRDALTAAEGQAKPLVAVGTAVGVADLHRSRSEADELLALLRAGQVPDRLAVYEDLWHLLVLNRMAGAATDAGVASLGPLPLLREHDRSQGTEYLNTLHAWLRHPGDPRTASHDLRVHPNTFRYRMKRITQLVDVDLDDPDVRSALLVQLLAARWARQR
ncbi:DNA-binding PucR family transcriptional regulator [Saccharopolyspora erythraea NRRL 2338]|uniref:DNA-binding protein n=2 Tax=Saccharopolyspora erythraea TaxID=1836 RepID=A4FNC4_SACEN|nr:helix-turn-helix domain-containing protein [Saccharopolyspora erythraea]EQD87104.1 DNA-binding protein [Saccharopolyspora erythraea D]PFG99188.1 DNA-binding PucR family transcriptional regulator [Saccharopolyspora erythraea NRRL 2338]QRK89137.1 helix-turn-helix domain-containing protein [Saccharopolyspora erythraea]CAM05549.1 DNA-binding protein [Saccharopolyspora erythraea NRRL 2338]